MAKDKKSVIMYVDWITTFNKLNDDEAGRLIKHFFRYVNDIEDVTPDRLTEIIFEPIKLQLKRDLKSYEQTCIKNKENALLRWQNKNATASDRIKINANHADNDNDNDNDNDKKNKKAIKVKFSDFVSLSKDEHEKLITEFGEKDTLELISILNNYKGANGKKYKSDYLAIKNWVVERMVSNKQKLNGKTFNTSEIRNGKQSIASNTEVLKFGPD